MLGLTLRRASASTCATRLALVLLFSEAMLFQFVGGRIATGVFDEGFVLRQAAPYLLATSPGRARTRNVYAVVSAPPRPPRAAVAAASVATMLLVSRDRRLPRIRRALAGLRHEHGVFATLIVGLIWL